MRGHGRIGQVGRGAQATYDLTGVILFKPVPEDAALRLILEGSSDDFDAGKYGTLTWTMIWK